MSGQPAQLSAGSQPGSGLTTPAAQPGSIAAALLHQHRDLLESLPVPLAATLAQQISRADILFPPELTQLSALLAAIAPPRSVSLESATRSFAGIHLSPALLQQNWRATPAAFVESMTAELWSSGQITRFREAARLLLPPQETLPAIAAPPRIACVVFARSLGAAPAGSRLFRRLRPLGTSFPHAQDPHGRATLGAFLEARLAQQPAPFSHWYVTGGDLTTPTPPALCTLSYSRLRAPRQRLLALFNAVRHRPGSGPEDLRNLLATLVPEQLGLEPGAPAPVRHLALEIFTGGSGTQLYATTFVQWSAREILRRAQPQTLLLDFTPRSAMTAMDERLADPAHDPPPDPAGSLVDAEMAAFYTLLNLQRLPGASDARFLVWHEATGEAILIAPTLTPGATLAEPTTMPRLLAALA